MRLTLALLILLSVPATTLAHPSPWHVALTGDVMLGSDHGGTGVPPREARGLLDAAAPVLQGVQVAIGNLEGTIGDGTSSGKNCANCHAFRSPPFVARRLQEAGYDLWSQANNHARDFGSAGMQQTRQWLAANRMQGTGPQGWPMAGANIQGRTFCLLAYAPNAGMNDLRDIPRMQQQVRQAHASCQLIAVSFHGGAEGSDKIRTPQGVEYYLGENRGDVRQFARSAIDAGASLVFGHGPHVPRGMELYRGRLIAYSLGNFMTYGAMKVDGVLGYAPLLELELAPDGTLRQGRVHCFRQSPRQPLRPDPSLAAFKLMQARTREDFHGGGLQFGVDGSFLPAP